MAVRSPKEALEGVLLEAEQDTLKVTASDGNMTSITCMSAVIEEPGSVIIPGKLTGVPPDLYAFHRYTGNSAYLCCTLAEQYPKQFPP